MDILSGIFKQINIFHVDDIFKQSLNVIQKQILKSKNTKKSMEYKTSPLDQITVDQIDVLHDNEQIMHIESIKMRLTDQISVNQVSEDVIKCKISDQKQKKKIDMNESCIHIGSGGRIVIREVPKAADYKNKITYMPSNKKIIKKMKESISFSGGGYNCVYHLGIVKYIFENPDLFKGMSYLGASGGAGIASIALCYESDPDKLIIIGEIIKDIVSMRSMNLKLSEQVERYSNILERYIDEDKFNKYIKRRSRCYISVTDVSDILPKNIVMNNFESYEQYIESLKASACIPILLDDKIRTVDGKWCLDGGLSNNIPTINEHTLRVSCLNYPLLRADIYPKYICELRYSFISPEEKYIMSMFDLGYNDMKEYMREHKQHNEQYKKNNDIDQCIKCLVDDPFFVS